MGERAGRLPDRLLRAAAGLGLCWLALRYALPWAAPFLVSLAAAALLEPAVRALLRRGWRRKAASLVLTLAVTLLLLWAALALGSRLLSALSTLAGQAPGLMAGLEERLALWERELLRRLDSAPEPTARLLRLSIDALKESLSALPGQLSQAALDLLGRAAQSGPGLALFTVTAGVGTCFVSASFPQTLAFLAAQLPAPLQERLDGFGREMRGSLGGFLRAQALLMALTFFELLPAFLLLRVEGAAGLAAVTALIDALPVFGTGAVLVPWAAVCFLLGQSGRGLGLLLTWGLTWLVRSAAQPKLLGDQIGLDPLASLLAVYVGWRACGVGGMLLFPLLLVTLCQLQEKGLVHLWNEP